MTSAKRYGIIKHVHDNFDKGIIMSIYNVIVHEAEEGGYWAEVPDLPGCVTEADTLDELKEMLKDAISVYLADETEPRRERTSLMQVAV